MSVSAVPLLHGVQDVVPALVNVPALHVAHGVDGSESVSALPATQAVQLMASFAEYVPEIGRAHV